MSINLNTSRNFDYTLTVPTFIPPAIPPEKNLVINDNLRSLANAGESDCCSRVFENLKESFEYLYEWISSFFIREAPSDPALLAKWDRVVEKDYDPVGATHPYYTEDSNRSFRGHTIADSLIRAASKTGITPPFKNIIIMKKSGAGLLFTADGQFTRLDQRARAGEFDSPDTLIITAIRDQQTESQKLAYNQARINVCARDGYPIHNATMLVISGSELRALDKDRMPSSLLKFFKDYSPAGSR